MTGGFLFLVRGIFYGDIERGGNLSNNFIKEIGRPEENVFSEIDIQRSVLCVKPFALRLTPFALRLTPFALRL
jgi:hypothetical protein